MSNSYILRPDAKGRISLGKLALGVSGFEVYQDKVHHIILIPLVEIPAREQWLLKNKEVLSSLKESIQQSEKGQVKSLGSFSAYLNDEND